MKNLYINYYPSKNFGDALNPILVKWLLKSMKKNYNVVRYDGIEIPPKEKIPSEPIYMAVGSILSWANEKNIVWGSGFISEDSELKGRPKKILAVRGPLTRQKVLEQGADCPEVYGDPALLLPMFYSPKVKKRYKLGIIPHYIDMGVKFLEEIKGDGDVLIININSPIKKVIEDILSCEKIASSSLHGIIVSDAYKVPSVWLEFSDKVLGGGFKFKDYFLSVNRKNEAPLRVTEKTTLKEIEKQFHPYEIKIDLQKLLDACPFNNLE